MSKLIGRKFSSRSFEKQTLDSYREGFNLYLKDQSIFFKTIDQYMKIFDKVFTTSNIITYHNLKIPQVKTILDHYIKEKKIKLITE
jgi:hypothetical protein